MVDTNTARLAALALSGGLLTLSLDAQQAPGAPQGLSQEQLIARREAKLAEPFIENADWVTDYDQALAMAKKSGKPIFAYFSRSFAP